MCWSTARELAWLTASNISELALLAELLALLPRQVLGLMSDRLLRLLLGVAWSTLVALVLRVALAPWSRWSLVALDLCVSVVLPFRTWGSVLSELAKRLNVWSRSSVLPIEL
jgi:hypothetical protein